MRNRIVLGLAAATVAAAPLALLHGCTQREPALPVVTVGGPYSQERVYTNYPVPSVMAVDLPPGSEARPGFSYAVAAFAQQVQRLEAGSREAVDMASQVERALSLLADSIELIPRPGEVSSAVTADEMRDWLRQMRGIAPRAAGSLRPAAGALGQAGTFLRAAARVSYPRSESIATRADALARAAMGLREQQSLYEGYDELVRTLGLARDTMQAIVAYHEQAAQAEAR